MHRLKPRSPNPELRRDIIVEAATAAIAKHGLNGVTIVALSRDIRIPAQTINGQFRGKHDILLEICERHLDRLLLAVEQADLPKGTTRRRLDLLAKALLTAIEAHAPAHRVLMIGLTNLGADRQHDLRRKQTWLVALFAEALEAVVPDLAGHGVLTDTATRSLILLLQAHDVGCATSLSSAAYARFAVSSILEGTRSELRSGSR